MASKTLYVGDKAVFDDGLDNTPAGQTTPAAGKFTNMDVTGILKYSGTPQVLTGAGAVNITTSITHLVTAGAGDALTLADGAEGQEKFIVTKTITTENDTSVLTPTTPSGFATLTFDNVGDSAHLLFTNAAWHFMGGTATVA